MKKMAADGAAKAKSVSKDAMDKSKVLAQKGKVMAKQGLMEQEVKQIKQLFT